MSTEHLKVTPPLQLPQRAGSIHVPQQIPVWVLLVLLAGGGSFFAGNQWGGPPSVGQEKTYHTQAWAHSVEFQSTAGATETHWFRTIQDTREAIDVGIIPRRTRPKPTQ